MLASGVQIVLVYFTAGLFKASREQWQQGVAIHYISQLDVHSLHG